MTTKEDFSEQEWQGLIQAPVMAGTYIIMSDLSVTAMPKEMKGMVNAIMTEKAPPPAQELVVSLVADISAKIEQKENLEDPKLDSEGDPRSEILDLLKQDLFVLDEKTTPGEKAGFFTWLMQIAQTTAEAGREGGFLGIGSTRVSDKEKAALEELRQAFGYPRLDFAG